jgi:hypothetical protein
MIALEAVYNTLHLHLGSLCGGRVSPDLVRSDTPRPYIMYTVQSGGSIQRRQHRRIAEYTFVVRKYADTLAESFQIQDFQDLLHDNGTQGTNTLPVNAEWIITNVTQGSDVHEVQEINGQPLYSTGSEFVFIVEQRP